MSQSRSSRSFTPGAGRPEAIRRRPHEGAGPCVPFAGRRPGRCGGRAGAPARLVAAALLAAAVVAGAALLAACGGSSGGAPSSPAPSPAIAPGSRPFPGSPSQAAAAYWALVDAGDYAGLSAGCTPGSAAALTATSDDIERARLLRVARVRRDGTSAQVQADVRIVPAGGTTPWGEAGAHTLFIELAESDGGWLVASWGTGP